MNCAEARELLLESELADLRMEGGSPLAEHLMACPSCQELARSVVEMESALASALGSREPDLAFEEAVVAAATPEKFRRSHRRRLRVLPALVPLAAAAVLVLLLLPRSGTRDEFPGRVLTPAMAAELPAVEAPPGKTAMILDTGNPDVQIIWLF